MADNTYKNRPEQILEANAFYRQLRGNMYRRKRAAMANSYPEAHRSIIMSGAEIEPDLQMSIDAEMRKIAPLFANNIKKTIIASDAVLYKAKENVSDAATRFGVSPIATENFFNNFDFATFKTLTGRGHGSKSSGFISSRSASGALSYTMSKYGVNQSAASIQKGIDNIKKMGGAAAVWDLETLGGKDIYGHQRLDHITEFNFQIYGKESEMERTFGSIIGISKNQEIEYSKIIEDYAQGRGFKSGRDRVIYERLSLLGHKNTVVDFNGSKSEYGIFRFKSFAGKEDIAGSDASVARKGLALIRNIGERQSKAKKVMYPAASGFVEMLGWEAELFSALDTIQTRNLTAVGHNTMLFDHPAMNVFLRNGLLSEGAKAYRNAQYTNGWHAANVFDTLAATRAAKESKSYTSEELAVLREHGLTGHQQEFLMRTLDPHFYDEGAAHVADIDTKANAILALKSGMFGIGDGYKTTDGTVKKLDNVLANGFQNDISIGIKGDRSQLFVSTSGQSVMHYNLYAFQQDSMTGAYHTLDGRLVSEAGNSRALYGSFGLQRGVAYSVSDVRQAKLSEELMEAFGGINQHLNTDTLYSVTLMREHQDEGIALKAFRALSPMTLVGTKEDIENYLDQNLALVGERDVQSTGIGASKQVSYGAWKFTDNVTEETKNLLGFTKVVDGKVTRSQLEDPNDVLAYSDYVTLNDASARARRDFSLSKDRKMLQFIDYLDKEALQRAGENATEDLLDEKRNEIRNEIRDRSIVLSREEAAHPNKFRSLSESEARTKVAGTFQDFFGYYDRSAKRMAYYSTTFDNAAASEEFVRRHIGVYRAAINAAIAHSSDTNEQKQIYENVMQSFIAQAEAEGHPEDYGKLSGFVVESAKYLENGEAKTLSGLPNFDFQKFEVNLAGFSNIKDQKASVRISLGGSGLGIADSIQKIIDKDRPLGSRQAKVGMLRNFQDFLLKSRQAQGIAMEAITADDTEYTASQKIVAGLSEYKKTNPDSGIISDTVHYSVLRLGQKNMGFAEEKLAQLAEGFAKDTHVFSRIGGETSGAELRMEMEKFVQETMFNRQDLLRDTDDAVEKLSKETGYSKKEARMLLKARAVQFDETVDLMTRISRAVRGAGGNIGYSLSTGAFYVTGSNGSIQEINNLARNVFSDGFFYTKIGSQKLANPVGFYRVGYGDNEFLTFGSRIQYASSQKGWMETSLQRAAKNGEDLGDATQSIVNEINKVLRIAPAGKKGDAQEMKMAGRFEMEGLIASLGKMQDISILDKDGAVHGLLDFLYLSGEEIKKIESLSGEDRRRHKNYGKYIASQLVERIHEKGADALENIPYNELTALYTMQDELFEAAQKYIEYEDVYEGRGKPGFYKLRAPDEEILHAVSFRTKATGSNLMHGTFFLNSDVAEAYDSYARGIHEQGAHAIRFDLDHARKMYELGEIGNVEFGKGLHTESRAFQAVSDRGVGSLFEDTVRMMRLGATTKDVRWIVNEAIKNNVLESELDKYMPGLKSRGKDELKNAVNTIGKILTAIDTHEGSAAMSIDLLDNVFTTRPYEQVVRMREIVPHENMRLLDLSKYEGLLPSFDIDEAGNVSMTIDSNTSHVVREGEIFAEKLGYEGSPDGIRAKVDGMARSGVMTDENKLASQEWVNSVLNSAKDPNASEIDRKRLESLQEAIRLSKSESTEESIRGIVEATRIADEILEQHNLSRKLYLRALDAQTHVKVLEIGAEKQMTQALTPEIGSVDKRIRTVINELLGEGSVSILNERGRIVGKRGADAITEITLNRSLIDSMLEIGSSKSVFRTDFGKVLQAYSQKDLVEKEFFQAIRNAGFEGNTNEELVRSFHGAIIKERRTPWAMLQKAAEAKGISGDFLMVSDTFEAERKHKNVGVSLQRIVDTLLNQGMTEERVAKELSSSIDGIHKDERTGRLLVNESEAPNFDELEKTKKRLQQEGYNFETGVYFDESGAPISRKEYEVQAEAGKNVRHMDYAVSTASQMENYDIRRVSAKDDEFGKRVKMTHRNIEILAGHTYDHHLLSGIRSGMTAALGEEGAQKFEQYFGGAKEGDVIAQGLIDNIKENAYVRPSEDIAFSLEKDGKWSARSSAVEALERKGIDSKFISGTLDVIGEKGATNASGEFIERQYGIVSAGFAHDFNRGAKNATLESMEKKGFKKMTFDELFVGSTTPEAFVDSSIFENNVLLDLNMPELGEKQVYGNGQRYVALPYFSKSFMGNGDKVLNEYQQSVRTLFNQYQRYRTAKEDGSMSEEKLAEARDRMGKTYEEIQSGMSKVLTAKHKLLAQNGEFELADSAILNTHGLQLMGDEQSEFFRGLSFDGINLVEQAKRINRGEKGIEFAHAIASNEIKHRFYNDKYFESIGLDANATKDLKKNVFEALGKTGTLSSRSKDPQGYIASTGAAALYFDDIASGDKVFVSSALQAASQNDNDSDKITLHLLKGKADITVEGKTHTTDIDYATYNALKDMNNVDVKLHGKTEKLFQDSINFMYMQGTTIAPNYQKKRGTETLGIDEGSFENKHLSENMLGGRIEGAYAIPIKEKIETDNKGIKWQTFVSNKKYDAEGIANLEDRLRSTISDYRTSLGKQENGEELVSAFDAADDAERRRQLTDYIGQTTAAGTERDEAMDMLASEMMRNRREQDIASQLRKGGAGSINYHAFGYYQRARGAHGVFNGIELRDIFQVHTALNEAFLSPKNERGVGDLQFIEKMEEAEKMVFSAASNGGKGREEAESFMVSTLGELLEGRRGKELSRLDDMYDETGKKIEMSQDDKIQRAFKTFASVASRTDMSMLPKMTMLTGASNKGIGADNALTYAGDNAIHEQAAMSSNIAERVYGETPFHEVGGIRASKRYAAPSANHPLDRSLGQSTLKAVDAPAAAEMSATESIVKGIAGMANRLRGGSGIGNIVAGALGGIMLAGYGSSPATPSTRQANAAKDYEDMYAESTAVPSLSDSNINAMRGVGTGGSAAAKSYVINIAARSPSGQARAANAIAAAINSQTPQGTSTNINMQTNYTDQINQLQLSRLVANSMGI